MKKKNSKSLFTIILIVAGAIWSGAKYMYHEDTADKGIEHTVELKTTVNNTTTAEPNVTNTNSGKHTSQEKILVPAPSARYSEQRLSRAGYEVSYNAQNRIPNWVAWLLTSNHTNGSFKRSGIAFQEDTDVPTPRATHFDYVRSGYDRGHMCPSGDNRWSKEAQEQSFLMTNICPQNHNLNAGDWNEMEQQCRKWAKKYGNLHIVAGPILYRGAHKTIGKNKVVVPEAFFKVVLCMKGKPKAIGFVYKNAPGNRPKGDYVNTIDQIERITGIDFFADLPDEIEKKVEAEADIDDWQ